MKNNRLLSLGVVVLATRLWAVSPGVIDGEVQPPPVEVIGVSATSREQVARVLQVQSEIPLGPKDILRGYEEAMGAISRRVDAELASIAQAMRDGRISREQGEYLSGERYQVAMMQYQLLSALHAGLEEDLARFEASGQRPNESAMIVQSPESPLSVSPSVARYLQLTESQVTAVNAILEEESRQTQPLLEQLASNRRQLADSRDSAAPDEKQVRKLAAESSRLTTELMLADARARARIYHLLSPEQQARVHRMRESSPAIVAEDTTEF